MKALFLAGLAALVGCVPAAFAKEIAGALPRLAVTVAVEQVSAPGCESLEDLLAIELANQPFLQLVDRQAIHAVVKEHALALSNPDDMNSAVALGKFVGADYLLHVVVEKRTATVRLVEVAGGRVKLDEQLAIATDLALFSAAIRERVLAALRPESRAASRLTVGITEFPNRSGTDRSDKLGIELQKALRKRLQDQPWAVVLERQYPTALLDEVDLARMGLVRDKAVETLPPADLVIFGSLEDADREYQPGKPWQVTFNLTVRMGGRADSIRANCRCDAMEAAAGDLMRQIDAFRRARPAASSGVPEKELWRRQALYLMPRQSETWRDNVLIPNYHWSSELNNREVVRAWENVLLLDGNDADAMTHLGVYLISCNRWLWNYEGIPVPRKQAAAAQCIAGSQLVERALRVQSTRERAATYVFCLRPLIEVAPARAKEMAEYVVQHSQEFKDAPDHYLVEIALAKPGRSAAGTPHAELERSLANAATDPNALLILFRQGLTRNGPLMPYSQLLGKYLDSPDPVVQFVVHRGLGELLCWQERDPAALAHFDAAIAALEAAYRRCGARHRDRLNDIYRLRIEACQFLDRPDEAQKTAVAGVRHFRDVGRFDDFNTSIGWLYEYCVTQALGAGQEREALAVCNAYFAAAREHLERCGHWPRISARREELSAKLAGRAVPDMGGLRFVTDSEWHDHTDLMRMRIAATGEAVWFVPCKWGGGPAMCCRHDGNGAVSLPEVPFGVNCVAATQDAVFFGGYQGLYKLDVRGKLLKQYDLKSAAMPGDRILDACEGGGKIYFSFEGSPLRGVAVLDPATDKIAVLAPSSREATPETEPVNDVRRIRWDAATPRLYACDYFGYNNNLPMLVREYGWSPHGKAWQPYPIKDAPRFVVSQNGEALRVRIVGDRTELHFVRSGQKLMATVPVPSLMGEPAWDECRIWVPTSSGLYEIDRATGHVSWVAYQDANSFLTALKHGNRLYVATARGLCYREMFPTAESDVKPATAAMTTAERGRPGTSSAALPLELSLEDHANAEVTISLDRQKTLQQVSPGKLRLDLTMANDGRHHLFFHCPGYAAQGIAVEVVGGKASAKQFTVQMFRKRYVILRCAFNTRGGCTLDGDGVEEQHLALSHGTAPDYFNRDWQIWQTGRTGDVPGDTPYLRFHRYAFYRNGSSFGFVKPAPGVTYEKMKAAPESGYRYENMKAEKGLLLYCRVHGSVAEQGLGFGKLLVEAVTETPPRDIRVVDVETHE